MTQLLFYHLLFQCNIKIQVTTVFAADAVARMSGTIGVAAVTAGPGKELKMDTRTKIRCDKIESVPNDGQIDNMFKGMVMILLNFCSPFFDVFNMYNASVSYFQ